MVWAIPSLCSHRDDPGGCRFVAGIEYSGALTRFTCADEVKTVEESLFVKRSFAGKTSVRARRSPPCCAEFTIFSPEHHQAGGWVDGQPAAGHHRGGSHAQLGGCIQLVCRQGQQQSTRDSMLASLWKKVLIQSNRRWSHDRDAKKSRWKLPEIEDGIRRAGRDHDY